MCSEARETIHSSRASVMAGNCISLAPISREIVLRPAEVDALLWARWGGSGLDAHSRRQAVSQQSDGKFAKIFGRANKIPDEGWQGLFC
eukprot:794479-Pyramimonas_sp.AAC.1